MNETMGTRIEIIPALKDNFIYALVNGARCALIDPGEAEPAQRFLERHRLRLDYVLCTHHHADHVHGLPDLLKRSDAEVWCSPWDMKRIHGATKAVSARQRLWELDVEIMDVPGHTLGQIAYYFPKLDAVFPGDTLFSAGCGRLFEGTPEQMFTTMRKLASLPPETKVYFGHEYTLRNLEFVAKHSAAPTALIDSYREDCQRKLGSGHATTPTTMRTELALNPFLNAPDVATFTKWRTLRDNW